MDEILAAHEKNLSASISDLREAILDLIYKADSSVPELVTALRKRGFRQQEPAIISLVQSAVAELENATNIKTDSRNGEVIYRWVGQHYGSRRSLANRAVAHAVAQQELEGLKVPESTVADLRRAALGEIGTDEVIRNIYARFSHVLILRP